MVQLFIQFLYRNILLRHNFWALSLEIQSNNAKGNQDASHSFLFTKHKLKLIFQYYFQFKIVRGSRRR